MNDLEFRSGPRWWETIFFSIHLIIRKFILEQLLFIYLFDIYFTLSYLNREEKTSKSATNLEPLASYRNYDVDDIDIYCL